MAADLKNARHADIKRRYRRRPKAQPRTLASIRVNELTRLFRARHGYQLPDTPLGRDHAGIMCQHLAEASADPLKRINDWLGLWCPWMTIGEAKVIREQCILQPRRWKAKTLGFRLRLVDVDRATLGIRTIAAVDLTPAMQLERRKLKAKLRAKRSRLRRRKLTRVQYLIQAKRPKPWVDLGISRATWYRVRQRETG